MSAQDAIAAIERFRLVAIVRLAEPGDAVVEALEAGGVRVMEISLVSSGALAAISRWRERFAHLVIGAGTVLTRADAARATTAGASFLISPGRHPEVSAHAEEAGVPYIPGALTPTEVHACASSGARLVKLFPASRLGSGYVRDLLGPFPGLRLVPTGGIEESNAREFLDAGAAAVAIGSSLVSESATPTAIQSAAARLTALTSTEQGAD
jgi:2-dehydro-3-deoxyphosphogluconate aldolase / (4S)-4-hydroxy-2-oxoglutarate aldolase